MPFIIRCKKLDRFMVEDVYAQSNEGMSYKSLKEMLELFGFDSSMINNILSESRINPAIYVDEENHSYRKFTNSENKFNPNTFFGKMFQDMAGSGNIDRFDQSNKNFGMKNFQMNSTEFSKSGRNNIKNKGGW